MKIKLNKNAYLKCTFMILLLHPLQRCISSIINSFIFFPTLGHYLMSSFYLITIFYSIFIMFFYKVKKKDICIYLLTICFWGISYLFSYNTREYFNSSEVKILFLFYLPLSIFIVSNVKNWQELFTDKFYIFCSDLLIFFSFLGKIINPERSDYMSYSYNLLPFWCIVLVSALYYKKKKQWIFVALSFFQGLFYGARGAIVWLFVCSLFILFLQFFYKNGIKKLFKIFLLSGILFLIGYFIFPFLMKLPVVSGSYILRRIQSGSLTSSSGRDILVIECLNILFNMNFSIYGLFYDRTILPNGWYSHNLIFEVFISFGWILGFLFLGVLFSYILVIFFKQKRENKIVSIFLLSSLFFRYFLSGSIFDEGNFWIFIGAMASLKDFKIKLGGKYLC